MAWIENFSSNSQKAFGGIVPLWYCRTLQEKPPKQKIMIIFVKPQKHRRHFKSQTPIITSLLTYKSYNLQESIQSASTSLLSLLLSLYIDYKGRKRRIHQLIFRQFSLTSPVEPSLTSSSPIFSIACWKSMANMAWFMA